MDDPLVDSIRCGMDADRAASRSARAFDDLVTSNDVVQIRVQRSFSNSCMVLYVDINGVTVCRIGGIVQTVEMEGNDWHFFVPDKP